MKRTFSSLGIRLMHVVQVHCTRSDFISTLIPFINGSTHATALIIIFTQRDIVTLVACLRMKCFTLRLHFLFQICWCRHIFERSIKVWKCSMAWPVCMSPSTPHNKPSSMKYFGFIGRCSLNNHRFMNWHWVTFDCQEAWCCIPHSFSRHIRKQWPSLGLSNAPQRLHFHPDKS